MEKSPLNIMVAKNASAGDLALNGFEHCRTSAGIAGIATVASSAALEPGLSSTQDYVSRDKTTRAGSCEIWVISLN
jgi:hypothetical protein